jgi:hypothetical protein
LGKGHYVASILGSWSERLKVLCAFSRVTKPRSVVIRESSRTRGQGSQTLLMLMIERSIKDNLRALLYRMYKRLNTYSILIKDIVKDKVGITLWKQGITDIIE